MLVVTEALLVHEFSCLTSVTVGSFGKVRPASGSRPSSMLQSNMVSGGLAHPLCKTLLCF